MARSSQQSVPRQCVAPRPPRAFGRGTGLGAAAATGALLATTALGMTADLAEASDNGSVVACASGGVVHALPGGLEVCPLPGQRLGQSTAVSLVPAFSTLQLRSDPGSRESPQLWPWLTSPAMAASGAAARPTLQQAPALLGALLLASGVGALVWSGNQIGRRLRAARAPAQPQPQLLHEEVGFLLDPAVEPPTGPAVPPAAAAEHSR